MALQNISSCTNISDSATELFFLCILSCKYAWEISDLFWDLEKNKIFQVAHFTEQVNVGYIGKCATGIAFGSTVEYVIIK